jgi:hypothetical protein
MTSNSHKLQLIKCPRPMGGRLRVIRVDAFLNMRAFFVSCLVRLS